MQPNTYTASPKSRGTGRKGADVSSKAEPSRTATPNKPAVPNRTDVAVSREQAIANAAYLLAERDGFPSGRDMDYWLKAEAEFDRTASIRPQNKQS